MSLALGLSPMLSKSASQSPKCWRQVFFHEVDTWAVTGWSCNYPKMPRRPNLGTATSYSWIVLRDKKNEITCFQKQENYININFQIDQHTITRRKNIVQYPSYPHKSRPGTRLSLFSIRECLQSKCSRDQAKQTSSRSTKLHMSAGVLSLLRER